MLEARHDDDDYCLILFSRYDQITLMSWTGAHHTFAVETFFLKTGESVIASLEAFLAHVMLHRNDTVPDRIFYL